MHQDLALVETLSAAENVALGLGYARGFGGRIKWPAVNRRARETMLALGFSFDVQALVSSLSAAQQTEVAIVRALSDTSDARMLVLDEPTARLSADDTARLFAAMRRMRDRGMAVLFVSHHLDEVMAIADRATILRDGRNVATVETKDIDHAGLVRLLVGRAIDRPPAARPAVGDRVCLRVEDLRAGVIDGFSLEVCDGEVVGVAGLDGSGRETVVAAIFGDRERSGRLHVDERTVEPGSSTASIRAGMSLAPSDRGRLGLVASMTVRENLTLANVRRNVKGFRLNHARERAEVHEWIERLGVVTTGADAAMTTLSGGNQQKVLLARSLRLSPRVLLLDNPTQGVDVGAKAEIHSLIDDAAAAGTAVVVASPESEELVRLCHRVVVLHRGRIVESLSRGIDLTRERIDAAQLGEEVRS